MAISDWFLSAFIENHNIRWWLNDSFPKMAWQRDNNQRTNCRWKNGSGEFSLNLIFLEAPIWGMPFKLLNCLVSQIEGLGKEGEIKLNMPCTNSNRSLFAFRNISWIILSALESTKRYEEIVCVSENLFTNRKLRLEEDVSQGQWFFKKLLNINLPNKTKLSAVLELCNLEG